MGRRAFAVAVWGLAACLPEGPTLCDDGTWCPSGKVCFAGGCARPEAIEACVGRSDLDPCDLIDVGAGLCEGGVCVVPYCSDGRRQGFEVCDDHNLVDGDGCNATCSSDETCGNGFVDSHKGEECDDAALTQHHDGCTSACRAERGDWSLSSARSPGARSRPAMAFDPVRQTSLLFGGYSTATGAVTADTWEWSRRNAAWAPLPHEPGPAARGDAALVWDAPRRKMLLFGGTAPFGAFDDLWEWDPDARTWTRRASGPGPRAGASMAFDLSRSRAVAFGGQMFDGQGFTYLDDTWEYDGATDTWTERSPAARPPARAGHGAVFDVGRQRMIVFGGDSADGLRNDTWEYDGADSQGAWAEVGPDPSLAPPPRAGFAIAYDHRFHRIELFGGTTDSYAGLAEHWTFDGSAGTWTQRPDAGLPPPRFGAAMASSLFQRIVLFGGQHQFASYDDSWEWDGATWTKFTPHAPFQRQAMGMSYDAGRGKVVIFGGTTFGGPLDDMWEWDPRSRAWGRRVPVGLRPPDRSAPLMVYDGARDRHVVFGGETADHTRLADLWEYDAGQANTWTERPPSEGPWPSARVGHAAAYDSFRQRLIFFGGDAGPTPGDPAYQQDIWEWDGSAWSQPNPTTMPPARMDAALAFDPVNGETVLFGGRDDVTPGFGDTWGWNGEAWTEKHPMTSPTGRYDHAMAYDAARARVVLFAGTSFIFFRNDSWEWDGEREDWTPLEPATLPTPRSGHGLVYAAITEELVTFGGSSTPETWIWSHARSTSPDDACDGSSDLDDDGLVGCADPDCWGFCTPSCPPQSSCPADVPACGNGTCEALETAATCPGDCDPTPAISGDGLCSGDETVVTEPADCGVCGDLICSPGSVADLSCPVDC